MTTVWFLSLLLGAYLLGALPVHYWAARLCRGIDLRKYGTGQVGTGNLWRMTKSWKIGLAVGAFDLAKGMVPLLVARAIGLSTGQQVAVGLLAVAGHNWSVFLGFSGGRGIATAVGLIIVIPLVNGLPPWALVAFLAVLVSGTLVLRSTPLPVLVSLVAVVLVSWLFYQPLSIALAFLAMLLIVVAKRLMAQRSAEGDAVSRKQVLLNRLLFDRDIADRKGWMYRKPWQEKPGEGGE